MTFEEFSSRGWREHGTEAEAVWNGLPEGLELADTPARIFSLAHLAAHVAGDHLGRWDDGIAFLDRLAALPSFDPATLEGKGLRRLQGVLHYCAGRPEAAEERLALAQPGGAIPPQSVRVRMLAAAASALASNHRIADATRALDEALRLAEYGPNREDPAGRDLAVAGNNLACELEERAELTPPETAFMLRAAEVGRRFWEIAGGWLQVERAEYRLAMSHLRAGLMPQALAHAQECLRVVSENGSEAGEVFFAHEALAKVRHALGQHEAARADRRAAAAALPKITDDGFRSYCEGELEKLGELLAG